MKEYTAWKQYQFRIRASNLDEAYDRLKELGANDAVDDEYWVDDTDYEEEE